MLQLNRLSILHSHVEDPAPYSNFSPVSFDKKAVHIIRTELHDYRYFLFTFESLVRAGTTLFSHKACLHPEPPKGACSVIALNSKKLPAQSSNDTQWLEKHISFENGYPKGPAPSWKLESRWSTKQEPTRIPILYACENGQIWGRQEKLGLSVGIEPQKRFRRKW